MFVVSQLPLLAFVDISYQFHLHLRGKLATEQRLEE